MRELFTMWQNTRMIVMTAISASAYVAVLLPFKGFVIIPWPLWKLITLKRNIFVLQNVAQSLS